MTKRKFIFLKNERRYKNTDFSRSNEIDTYRLYSFAERKEEYKIPMYFKLKHFVKDNNVTISSSGSLHLDKRKWMFLRNKIDSLFGVHNTESIEQWTKLLEGN